MKKFLTTLGLLLLIFGVLAGKIYLDSVERPRYYLTQIGTAIAAHDLVNVERWVDFRSVAQGIVADHVAGLAKQPEPNTVEALKNELIETLVEQMREYVKTGQFRKISLTDLTKPAQVILTQLLLTEDALKRFQAISYVKETGQTATAGLKSVAELGSSIVLELKLKRVDSKWRVVRINNFEEIQNRLHRRAKQQNIKIEDLLVQGVKNSVLWGKFDREEVFLELSSSAVAGWPTSLAINLDQQNRLCFTLLGGASKIPLRIDPGEAEAFEENGQLNSHYYVQAGEYDFDGDNQAELVIAIGDNNIDLVVDIFKYCPSAQGNPAEMEPKNWVLVKTLMGQNKAYLNGRNIRLPYTAVNVEVEYQWGKNGFQELR
jgi:hypothetical protein